MTMLWRLPMRVSNLICLALGAFSVSCASINSVSVTPIPANRSREVSAEASRLIFFFLNFDNDYVDQVSRELGRKCPNGRVSGILTKDETINYFLYLVHKRQVVATGYCDARLARGTASEESVQ